MSETTWEVQRFRNGSWSTIFGERNLTRETALKALAWWREQPDSVKYRIVRIEATTIPEDA